jgi:predicted nucleotidyltransferase
MNRKEYFNEIDKDLEIVTDYLESVGCSEIYIFGSLANDQASEGSDLDIAVRGIPAKNFFSVYGEILSRSSRPVDLVDLDLQEDLGRQILSNAHIRRVA